MNKKPQFAIILAGCGNFDGSEIHETTLGLLAIDQLGGEYKCFAPNIEQAKTINAYTKEVVSFAGEANNRNVLIEGARIARGAISPLTELKIEDYDAIIFPGGQGAINNWCDYAQKGINCTVNPEISSLMHQAYINKKWIGAMCIAPVVVAKVLGDKGIHITIGNDANVAKDIKQTGAVHEEKLATEACLDLQNKIATTPCYMLAKSIKEIYQGNFALIKGIINNL